MQPRIITSHVYPPIPVRDFDWCAYLEGEEEEGRYGYGRTRELAVLDFIDSYPWPEEDLCDSPKPNLQENP